MAAQFIDVEVTTTGDDLKARFNLHEPVQVVFNRALALVGSSANRDQFTLEYDDQPLELQRPLGDYAQQFNWSDKVVLDLVPRPEVI